MKSIIWFDLEETIIKDLEHIEIINFEKIKEIIKTHVNSNTEVSFGIFSFAIWDEKDISHFENIIKPFIEKVFNIKIEFYPSKNEMFNVIKAGLKKSFDFMDFNDFWNKSTAFIDFIKFSPLELNKFNHFFFDDMVTNCSLKFDTFSIHILNIDQVFNKKS